MVKINGEQVNAEGLTVSEYLAREKLAPERVAVMLGNEILPKSRYDSTAYFCYRLQKRRSAHNYYRTITQ